MLEETKAEAFARRLRVFRAIVKRDNYLPTPHGAFAKGSEYGEMRGRANTLAELGEIATTTLHHSDDGDGEKILSFLEKVADLMNDCDVDALKKLEEETNEY